MKLSSETFFTHTKVTNKRVTYEEILQIVKDFDGTKANHSLAVKSLLMKFEPICTANIAHIIKRTEEYINICVYTNMPATISSWCLSLGLVPSTVYGWKKGDSRRDTHYHYINSMWNLFASQAEEILLDKNAKNAIGATKILEHYHDYQRDTPQINTVVLAGEISKEKILDYANKYAIDLEEDEK